MTCKLAYADKLRYPKGSSHSDGFPSRLMSASVKYGSYTFELSKGKPSVGVASANDLIKTLETI